MPKLKKSASEKLVDAIRGNAHINCGGLAGLAKPMGCCEATVYNRIREPSELTLRQLYAIRSACGIHRAEMLELIAPLI